MTGVCWFDGPREPRFVNKQESTAPRTEFPLITAETDVRRIEVDPNNTERIWYSGVTSSKVGYVEMLN